MRIIIGAVGRSKRGPEQALFDHYRDRLPWPLVVKEVDVRGNSPPATKQAKEADLLRGVCPPGAKRVVLDEAGRTLDSVAFANRLREWRDTAVSDAVFLIGGADGHHQSLRMEADLLLSLGPMTWPHQLVRALLAEQLYRAHTILTSHPYHRA